MIKSKLRIALEANLYDGDVEEEFHFQPDITKVPHIKLKKRVKMVSLFPLKDMVNICLIHDQD